MSTFLTDENNDLYLTSTDSLAFADDGKEAIAQVIRNTLLTQRGELQLSVDEGIPYLETVLGNNPDVAVWEGYMIQAVEKIDGVLKVETMQSNISGNTLNYVMEIQTIYGTVTVEG